MKKYLPFLFIIIFAGCSDSGDSEEQTGQQTIAGTWFSECVEATSLPFPPAPAAYFMNGYVTVELNFDNGNVIADGVFHDDSSCSATDMPTQLFEGTYTLGDTTTSITGEQVNTIHLVGNDGLFFVSWDYESYFVIENEILYLDNFITSEIDIRRDVPYSR